MEKNLGLKGAVGVGVISLSLLVNGCVMSGSKKVDGPEITYPLYVKNISFEADLAAKKAVERKDVIRLKEAINLYLNIGKLKQAEKYTNKLLRMDRATGLRSYQDLQTYRNKHPELMKE
ncbi:hypothetical protein CL621_02850 [archaeon]|nr:hypothetical protein [archaeon]